MFNKFLQNKMVYKNFNLIDKEVVLKVTITDNYIITSWKHPWRNVFTNKREYQRKDKDLLLKHLSKVCNINTLNSIKMFILNKYTVKAKTKNTDGSQMSLF